MSFQRFSHDVEGWGLVRETVEFANPHLQVISAQIRTPSRPGGCPWTVVHRKAGAVVVPVTPDGNLLLIRQERVPVRTTLWEFPAGQVDEEGGEESIRQAALRELREEAGYELAPGGKLTAIGFYFTSPGFTDEHSYLFVAQPVVPCAHGRAPDAAEAILECREFSPGALRDMISRNEIRDANTLSAFARMCALGLPIIQPCF